MRIAVCDDDRADREMLVSLLAEYGSRSLAGVTAIPYPGGRELLEAARAGARFDVILLDILMPGFSGMETARELRANDKRVEIVFLTVSPDFALEAYSVRARHYIVKPVVREALFRLLDELADQLEREEGETLVVKTKSGLRRLRTDQLEYCEILGRTLYYHMASGAVFEGGGNLGKLEGLLLALPNFCKPHRSYLVNMDFIAHFDSRASVIELESMRQIPVPRARCGQVREMVQAYLDRKGARDQ